MPANMTASVLFTATRAVKFPSAVTWSSRALSLSYYRDNTFLPCRMNELKMNELSATVVNNQPFWLLWCPFSYLKVKLDCLKSNSIVTRELIPFLCRISKPTFIIICSTTFVTRPSILHPSTKKILTSHHFYFYFHSLCAPW